MARACPRSAQIHRQRRLPDDGNNVALFPAPDPELSILANSSAALSTAETQAGTGLVGAVQARNLAVAALVSLLKQERSYVQSRVDSNTSQAALLAEKAGMSLRKKSTYQKPPLSAKQGPASGLVLLVCLAAKGKAFYEWEMSLDQKTWAGLSITFVANTSVSGLTPGLTYFFRVRPRIKGPEQEWSQVVSFMVK